MQTYQSTFIELSQSVDALLFGEFTLKSGRISPYFFNAGKFNTGQALWQVADCYAEKILAERLQFDMIFGTAYKGIPLVAAIAVILSQKTGEKVPWAFNRKEVKEHGEGGWFIGSDIKGRVLVVDDVVAAGTAMCGIIAQLSQQAAEISGIIVALDRQEVASNQTTSAMQFIQQQYGIDIHAIIRLDDLIGFSKNDVVVKAHLPALLAYREQYGAK